MEMCRLARISKSICGPSLIRMRKLYLAKVRPMLAYGCAAWFLYGPDVKWRVSGRLIKKLESVERGCLRQIAGAFKHPSYECLLKELYIEPLEIHLSSRALAFLARGMGPSLRVKHRIPVGASRSSDSKPLEQHPYTVLDRYARELWRIARERLTEANKFQAKTQQGGRANSRTGTIQRFERRPSTPLLEKPHTRKHPSGGRNTGRCVRLKESTYPF